MIGLLCFALAVLASRSGRGCGFVDRVGTATLVIAAISAVLNLAQLRRQPELAQIPDQPLGEIDPARIDATLDVVKGAFRLAIPVKAADVYAPGFVPKSK
jgi:hypothetical protein